MSTTLKTAFDDEKEYELTGLGTQFVHYTMNEIVPKIGPLKALQFKTPNAEAEKLFVESFDTVTVHYKIYTDELRTKNFSLSNIDYDTGKKTAPGEYELADENYGTLLLMLRQENFKNVTPSLKENILTFYNKIDSTDQKQTRVFKDIRNAIIQLKNYQPVASNN